MTDTYHDPPNLPLTHAASVALVREMMAKNPGAHPFTLWENTHVEVDPHIFVPTMVAEDQRREGVLAEVLSELSRRHPKADPLKLLERLMESLA
jgi:hypothetical protein